MDRRAVGKTTRRAIEKLTHGGHNKRCAANPRTGSAALLNCLYKMGISELLPE
jgi:hypothetical protein